MNAGILSYGVSIPRCRIQADEILQVWKNTHKQIIDRMGFKERGVLYPDQDTITLAIDAGSQALERTGIAQEEIGALILGTGTNPYTTKGSVSVVGEALGLRKDIISFDLQFSGKSGTSGIIAAQALVESGQVSYALAIGADTMNRHIPPGHWQEYSASAGAVALLIGRDEKIVDILGSSSYAQDQNDSFRVEGERYIQVGCGITGYVYGWGVPDNMIPAGKKLLEEAEINPEEIDACALHQSNFVVPHNICGPLGLDFKKQIYPYLLTPRIGDCGSASSLLALAYILDEKQSQQKILLGSYGIGAGSDFIYLQTTSKIKEFSNHEKTVNDLLDDKIIVNYGTAQKYEYKLLRPENMITGYL